ncbi:hypothetical protein BpHYR1_013478 [Brachionus plicatilis]|uniref:Uncharacterized protein n=1 Tax=Brachionus plicatilis TaxID=10195 RepID=A0A3M7PCA6_BRAPC|nr:hypothetical protein BpHYR1_013478 [Brachionus plicatilis]
MSSSASILENNFNDTVNDAEEYPKTKRSKAKAYDFMKHYKCYHITTIAALRMDLPIQANRKRGQPKGTTGALEHQPKETQSSNLAPKGIDSDYDDASNPIEENVSKRPRIVSNI